MHKCQPWILGTSWLSVIAETFHDSWYRSCFFTLRCLDTRRATRTYSVNYVYFKLLITSPWIWMNIVTCYILLSDCLFLRHAYTSSWIFATNHVRLRWWQDICALSCFFSHDIMTSPWDALKKCHKNARNDGAEPVLEQAAVYLYVANGRFCVLFCSALWRRCFRSTTILSAFWIILISLCRYFVFSTESCMYSCFCFSCSACLMSHFLMWCVWKIGRCAGLCLCLIA